MVTALCSTASIVRWPGTVGSGAADFASNEHVFKFALVWLVSFWEVLGEKCLIQVSLCQLHCIVWCVEVVLWYYAICKCVALCLADL